MACKVYDNKNIMDETPTHPPLLFPQSVPPAPFTKIFAGESLFGGPAGMGKSENNFDSIAV